MLLLAMTLLGIWQIAPKLALPGAELKLCNWGIYFYPNPGSTLALNAATSHADNGSTITCH